MPATLVVKKPILLKIKESNETKIAQTTQKSIENIKPVTETKRAEIKIEASRKPLDLFTDDKIEPPAPLNTAIVQTQKSVLVPIESGSSQTRKTETPITENKPNDGITKITPAAGPEIKSVAKSIIVTEPEIIPPPPKQVEPITPTEKIAAIPEKKETKIEAQKEQDDPKINKKILNYGQIQIWEGRKGDWLKKTLAYWAKQSDVKLVWNTRKKAVLEMDMYVSGTLENALKTLFSVAVKNGPAYKLDKETNELTITD